MGNLIGKLAALVAYVCVATFVAIAAGLGYLRFTGKLPDDRMDRVLAAIKGKDLAIAKPDEAPKPKDENPEQPSFEERDDLRELKARDLEIREQSLKSGLDRIRFEKDKLTEERDRYNRIKGKFEEELDVLHQGAISTGKESVRLIWENIKPKQAKEQIMQMIEANEIDDVVSIMGAMPIARRAKIITEFKSPEEVEKLGDVLRLIREGVPQVDLIEKTKDQIKQP